MSVPHCTGPHHLAVIDTVTGDLDDLVRIVKAIGCMDEAAVFRMRPG